MRFALTIAASILLNTTIAQAAPPSAVIADQPPDKAFPPGFTAVAVPSHGVRINAVLFTAAGAGAHPTVLLLHGFPGNEQNLDIARALQRAGWNVLTLHYRGSGGSPGSFSFAHCLEDAAAALDWLRHAPAPFADRIDPSRIVLAGHSLGAWAAGYAVAHLPGPAPGVMGLVLISSTRIGGQMRGWSHAAALKVIEGNLLETQGLHPIGDTTGDMLADEAIVNATAWDLRQFGPAMARQPVFVITADDGLADWDEGIAAAVEAAHIAPVTRRHFATDHSYNDQRIGLTAAIIEWLSSLPGAPAN